jgi:hypothetical protein
VDCSRTEYSSWRPCFHKNCPTWASQIQHPCRAATAKPLITESNVPMCKQYCRDHKTWILGNWKRACNMVRWVILNTVPYIRKSLRLENTQGNLLSPMHAWFQQWNTGEVLWWFG